MKKIMLIVVVLLLVGSMVLGCTRQNYQYPTGYAAYGQPAQPQYQGYVGGGCNVAGPDMEPADVSDPVAAA